MANLKLITNRTSITDLERLQEIIDGQASYKGTLPKYLEPLRPIIEDFSDERGSGNSCFVYVKRGLTLWNDEDLVTAAGANQKEIMADLKTVNIYKDR